MGIQCLPSLGYFVYSIANVDIWYGEHMQTNDVSIIGILHIGDKRQRKMQVVSGKQTRKGLFVSFDEPHFLKVMHWVQWYVY